MAVTPTPATGTPAETSEAIAGRLRLSATRLARRLRQQADTGLSPSQLSALAVVERHGPLTLGALAEHEQVAPPSVTRVVAKLETDGFLTRQADPDDRRVTRVAVTTKGRNLLVASRRRKTAWLTTRLESMDPDERARLADALDVLDALTTEPR
jgi:DNA-binding MarR family transcriptional regulator